ncbi:hypothetical protein FIBSPDRAFT_94902 [Athelia psychrophila]|uniref:Yeast cell wall synthesis Kre9/Knh1-like N-terminal domain-containing protein n=1 Tax=Athelia psychrophila TaxID=1759441 RepID=A0A166TPX0_9AGAM|nr:hypothetical protein FIBSPDRAFT_94902 [Fibularhizoctonia sp. CBS 109695]
MLAFRYILALNLALSAHASLYVVNPLPTTSCRASHPCTVQWLDDGTVPLLSDIGVSMVGLYSGDEELVQTITPVNVNNVHTLTFTPDPKAGPNSNKYYIAFTSTTLMETNGTGYYQSFSSNFRYSLTQMTGSLNSHPASDTSSKATPSSLRMQTATGTGAQSQSITTTAIVTVGTLSTSSYVVSTLPATGSSASSSTATTPAASASATGASGGAQSSGVASTCTVVPPLALLVLSTILSVLL